MRKIELTLSSKYVGSWTIVDAIRELFQNAFDREAQNPFAGAYWRYQDGTLTISNKSTRLETGSLLLGETTKNGSDTIGQFGEGYKLATLVLIRCGKCIVFNNDKEVWRPRFVKSRRFGADVLTFFIESTGEPSPDPTLDIEISGLTDDEYYNEIVPSVLRLRKDDLVLHHTAWGDVLRTVEGEDSAIYVGGLRICLYPKFQYSYNFKPGLVSLGRDRRIASDFDLKWNASRMWVDIGGHHPLRLIAEGSDEVAFVADASSCNTLALQAYDKFTEKYGARAIPVSYQADADKVPASYKAVIVNEVHRRILVRAPQYVDPIPDEKTPKELLGEWLDNYSEQLSDVAREELENIYSQLSS